MPGLLSNLWKLDPPPTETRPAHERRRARPYYHRHEHRQQATALDWVTAVALGTALVVVIKWAGAWPA